jgi:hypothetical protein
MTHHHHLMHGDAPMTHHPLTVAPSSAAPKGVETILLALMDGDLAWDPSLPARLSRRCEKVKAVLSGIRRTIGAAPVRKKAATADIVLGMVGGYLGSW